MVLRMRRGMIALQQGLIGGIEWPAENSRRTLCHYYGHVFSQDSGFILNIVQLPTAILTARCARVQSGWIKRASSGFEAEIARAPRGTKAIHLES